MRVLIVTGSFPAVTQTFVTKEAIAASLLHDVHLLAATQESASGEIESWIRSRAHFGDWRRTPLFPWPFSSWHPRLGDAADVPTYGRMLGLRRRRYFARLLSIPGIATTEVIHAHWTELALSIAVPLGALLGVPVTCTAHDSFLATVPTETLRRLQATTHTVVLVSSWSLEHWAQRTGSRSRLTLVPNGVDIPTNVRRPAADNTPVIVNVARCEAHKRQSDLLYTLALLRERGYRPRCVIVGAGPELDALRVLSAALNVAEQCQFTGAVPHQAALTAIAEADVFVLPSERESFGVVTAEAMAAGVPVIATNAGGSPDLVEEGMTGYLVPVADPGAIAEKLQVLLSDRALRCRMGDAGREKAIRQFSFERHMTEMLSIWERAIGSHTAGMASSTHEN